MNSKIPIIIKYNVIPASWNNSVHIPICMEGPETLRERGVTPMENIPESVFCVSAIQVIYYHITQYWFVKLDKSDIENITIKLTIKIVGKDKIEVISINQFEVTPVSSVVNYYNSNKNSLFL